MRFRCCQKLAVGLSALLWPSVGITWTQSLPARGAAVRVAIDAKGDVVSCVNLATAVDVDASGNLIAGGFLGRAGRGECQQAFQCRYAIQQLLDEIGQDALRHAALFPFSSVT